MFRTHGGTYVQPRWKIKRGEYVYRYYGSWDAVFKVAKRGKDGILEVPIPPELKAAIEADPECHPPKRRGFVDLLKNFWGRT